MGKNFPPNITTQAEARAKTTPDTRDVLAATFGYKGANVTPITG
jgi:hypothetical protein